MEKSEYSIKPAIYSFSCPVCGSRIRKGDNYVYREGTATCLCVLSSKKLKPIGLRRLLIFK